MITSNSNKQVKRIAGLIKSSRDRREEGLFVAEGRKMFLEAPADWIEGVFVSESFYNEEKNSEIGKKLNETGFETVKDDIFSKTSDTKTPQGVLSLLKIPKHDFNKVIGGKAPLIMVLEDLQDPGNLGTIVRTAEGAGVTGVVMSANTVDIFNPKTIRATMGSIYRMPFIYVDDILGAVNKLKAAGITTYAAHLKGDKFYHEFDYKNPTAFFIGNEGNGLTDELTKEADVFLKIPMEGKVESLNAAIAGAVLMYEAHRQRF